MDFMGLKNEHDLMDLTVQQLTVGEFSALLMYSISFTILFCYLFIVLMNFLVKSVKFQLKKSRQID